MALSPQPDLRPACSNCGLEDVTTTSLVKVAGRALDLSTTFAQEATIYKYQLEHVQQRYLDLLQKHDPAQVDPTQAELTARLDGLWQERDGFNFINTNQKDQLKELYEECGQWTQEVQRRNRQRDAKQKSNSSLLKPTLSTNHTSEKRAPSKHDEAQEQDFTTPGTPSGLKCPFQIKKDYGTTSTEHPIVDTPSSSLSKKHPPSFPRSKRASMNDPIRAEVCGYDPLPSAALTEGSAACPIRFIDQHSPEELAQYFEKHKHELPRSHEVCVRRYQRDSDSVRQLDAKYGNLVSMIQGLGEKHQHWLPDQPQDEEAVEDEESSDKVQKWAADVAVARNEDHGNLPPPAKEEEARQSHFDRPVKDIRVGESPSRPWGVSVPAKYYDDPESSSLAKMQNYQPPTEEQKPEKDNQEAPRKCPFDHTKLGPPAGHASYKPPELKDPTSTMNQTTQPVIIPEASNVLDAKDNHASRPQMVFNGPVFIGYPMAEALAALSKGDSDHKT